MRPRLYEVMQINSSHNTPFLCSVNESIVWSNGYMLVVDDPNLLELLDKKARSVVRSAEGIIHLMVMGGRIKSKGCFPDRADVVNRVASWLSVNTDSFDSLVVPGFPYDLPRIDVGEREVCPLSFQDLDRAVFVQAIYFDYLSGIPGMFTDMRVAGTSDLGRRDAIFLSDEERVRGVVMPVRYREGERGIYASRADLDRLVAKQRKEERIHLEEMTTVP